MPRIRRKAARQAQQPPKNTYSCDVQFAPAALEACGPLLRAAWSVPAAQATAMHAAGIAPPAPVVGSMLLDTGASRTAIALTVATELGLRPTRVVPGYGAAGKYDLPAFYAALLMSFQSGGRTLRVAREQEAVGIPDLDEMGGRLGISDTQGPVRIIGLLGRDFLRHAKFNYDGVKGVLHFVFDAGTLPPSGRLRA